MLAAIDEAEGGSSNPKNSIHRPGDRVLHLSSLSEQSVDMQVEVPAVADWDLQDVAVGHRLRTRGT